ncbi:hypothetical protein [Pseudomonas veronii]|uniref:Uncharacterized protein n=1 Tax=Pseudomonas veronii TaxID=76761 RepID=A0A5Q2U6I3_PSEVE|nr:hypothetical protein [Pseudomonas veronii]QGH44356.1 hypothetical protein E4167_35210 [Pseudomonas veronii]
MNDRQLIPGRFYWVIPLHVGALESWESEPQPAKFVGGDGWQLIGLEGDIWPARWVGEQIELYQNKMGQPAVKVGDTAEMDRSHGDWTETH